MVPATPVDVSIPGLRPVGLVSGFLQSTPGLGSAYINETGPDAGASEVEPPSSSTMPPSSSPPPPEAASGSRRRRRDNEDESDSMGDPIPKKMPHNKKPK